MKGMEDELGRDRGRGRRTREVDKREGLREGGGRGKKEARDRQGRRALTSSMRSQSCWLRSMKPAVVSLQDISRSYLIKRRELVLSGAVQC
jgi:hypothetical protein